MLNREQRIQRLSDSIHSRPAPKPTNITELFANMDSQPPTSESRFNELANPHLANPLMKTAAVKLSCDASVVVRTITDARDLPTISHDSRFKYSSSHGGSFNDYKIRMDNGEEVVVFTAQENQAMIGYCLVELNPCNSDHEVKIIDVETASRRSAGLYTKLELEGQPFKIGVAHLLVASIISHYDTRLSTDATHSSSRYVFKSLGFSGYSSINPCLLETRPKQLNSPSN